MHDSASGGGGVGRFLESETESSFIKRLRSTPIR